MSGGVDSSVTAALLREEGFEVVGLTLIMWREKGIPPPENVERAREVAKILEIEHHVLDATEKFVKEVVLDFADGYAKGWTPNPCVRCNQRVKFGLLSSWLEHFECQKLATGHYVRLLPGPALARGVDETKDQSYFLWAVDKKLLSYLLFPLGKLTKREVRQIAREKGLPTAQSKESQDICFVPGGNYPKVVEEFKPEALRPGPVFDMQGRRLGEHPGVARYTVGQRMGGLDGFSVRIYVREIDPRSNSLRVAERYRMFSTGVICRELNWLYPEPLSGRRKVSLLVRYIMEPIEGWIEPLGEGRVKVDFSRPIWAPAPGQSATFYHGEVLLGGAVIEEILWERD